MRIAVVGVGGVGGYFGGQLARAGHDVCFIARGAHLAAIREHGLRVDSIGGDFVVQPAVAGDDPAGFGPVDLVIVGVKAWQLPAAAQAMAPLVGPETVVLPLLNGIEAADELASALGAKHVLGGLCRITAFIAGPGHIRHAAMAPSVVFGELDNRRSSRVEAIQAAFTTAGVRAEIAVDIQVAIWEKFMLIATWSGIGAVTRTPIGAWRGLPGTRAMAEQALSEVVALAHARDIALPINRVARLMTFLDGVDPASTASMQRDIMEGRPSELEAQNGAIVRLSEVAGVDTPVHHFLYYSLLPQERAARGEA